MFQMYIQHNVWGLSDSIPARLAMKGPWGPGTKPSACTECGVCAEHCPQKIDIPAELKRVWPVLESL